MTQTPVYQPMVGMPAAMPMMPGAAGVGPMPGNSNVSVTAEGSGGTGLSVEPVHFSVRLNEHSRLMLRLCGECSPVGF